MMEKWKIGMVEWWNGGKPKGKPQRGETLIAQNDSSRFKGAAHRNILSCDGFNVFQHFDAWYSFYKSTRTH
jgi:hypothetical protein